MGSMSTASPCGLRCRDAEFLGENRRSLHYAPLDFLSRFVTLMNIMRLS
jgi:hypothetical protein